MKSALFIVSLFSAAALAQVAPAPFKGCNAIVIGTSDAPAVALQHLADAAKTQGYTVDSLTATVLRTSPKTHEFKRYGIITPAEHVFRVKAKADGSSTSLLITGTYRLQLNTTQKFEGGMAWYSATELSQDKDCFEAAQKLATAYPYGTVQYKKLPNL